jgi:3-oxoacyl-[acyl-carrier protein] reductase
MRFLDRRALVTGGGSGIGAATARALAAEGATVAVADIDAAAAAAVAEDLPAATAVQVDVSDAGAVDRAVRAAGPLDVVVHCAGIDDPLAKQRIAECVEAGQPLDVALTLPDERWRRQLAVNLDGTFHVLRAALRVMIPRGYGAIVVIGSSAAFDTPAGYGHYAAAKAGVHALCQSVAKEVVDRGVRINVVAPGPTDTGMATRTPPSLRAANAGTGRYARAEEIADVALFLASEAAANLAGAVLLANGGRFTR